MEKPSAYQGNEPYVFVCYAHEDSEAVYPEIAWLQAQGINVWYDEGIGLGTEWTEALADAIQRCTKFLFFVTPNSVDREHCRRELNFAQGEGRDVLAVHLRATEVSGGLRLSLYNRQAIFKHEISNDQYRNELVQAIAGASAAPTTPVTERPTSRVNRLGIFAVAAVVIAVAGAWWFNVAEEEAVEPEAATQAEPERSDPGVLHNSVAVLPFENLSPDPDHAYFAAGIHEEIINQLGKIRDLSVIARTSVMQYAGVHKPIAEIANDLSVSTVMEGSVRYAGNRVRITAQLIDGESGSQLWSEAYEEDFSDIFGIQLNIATRIADTLEAELTPTEQERIARRATDSPEAYSHYLRALNSWGSFASSSATHEALQAAVELDPNFAAAWALDAAAYALERHPRIAGPSFDAEAMLRLTEKAKEYALRALELNESEPLAHFTLVGVEGINWDWEAIYRRAEVAYALNPNNYLIAHVAGSYRMVQGDIDGGIALKERSIELNPADIGSVWSFGEWLYLFQVWEEAVRKARLLIDMAPQAAVGYALLAKVLSRIGDDEGVQLNAALAEARNPDHYALADVAMAFAQIGDADSAKRIFDLAGAGDESQVPDLHWQFWMHMATDQHDVALSYLERSIDENFPFMAAHHLHHWNDHPDYDPIRLTPTFQELVERVRFPREPSVGLE